MKKKKSSGKAKAIKNTGNPIHIRLGSEESLRSKKDMLTSEMSILKISQSISNYKNHRLRELTKKQLALKKLREAKRNITKLEKILPNLKLPKILQDEKPDEEVMEVKTNIKTSSKGSGNVEAQLREIQEKLNALQG